MVRDQRQKEKKPFAFIIIQGTVSPSSAIADRRILECNLRQSADCRVFSSLTRACRLFSIMVPLRTVPVRVYVLLLPVIQPKSMACPVLQLFGRRYFFASTRHRYVRTNGKARLRVSCRTTQEIVATSPKVIGLQDKNSSSRGHRFGILLEWACGRCTIICATVLTEEGLVFGPIGGLFCWNDSQIVLVQ
jgi:hypothetical protein